MTANNGIPSQANRAMILLAIAAFASQATVRVTDTMLPQIAADFGATVNAASIIITAYAIAHGTLLLAAGPVGDRFGKYPVVTIACALSAITVLICGLAQSVTGLALARLACGFSVAWIVPLGLAFVGDIVPYEQRQQTLARFMSGQILGQLFGQAAAGALCDLCGWRGVFFVLSAIFVLVALALVWEFGNNSLTHGGRREDPQPAGAEYIGVLSSSWARMILLAVFIEGMFSFGVFTFVSADLHNRFGLSFTAIGAIVALFAVGGLVYGAMAKPLVRWLGEIGTTIIGGMMIAGAFFVLAGNGHWWPSAVAVATIGVGFYMLHNTLLTNATQMCPEMRGTATALFGATFYLGQTAGVFFSAPMVESHGAPVAFLASTVTMPILVLWFASGLRRRRRTAAVAA